MGRLRDDVTVRVTAPVNGTPARAARGPDTRPRTSRVEELRVEPAVWAAAQRALRLGQRAVIVSATEVRIVNE